MVSNKVQEDFERNGSERLVLMDEFVAYKDVLPKNGLPGQLDWIVTFDRHVIF